MPFSRLPQSADLETADLDALRTVFDRLITEKNVGPDTAAYDQIAQTIIDIYLSGERDPAEIARQAMARWGA